jgi:hypothetical protein
MSTRTTADEQFAPTGVAMIRWASRIAVAGALLQIGYGVLACVFRYPTISDRPFEALWALANVAMIANIAVWLSIKVATPRLALIGGGLAILGHLIRVTVSLVIEARPDATVDTPIITSIMLMFLGLALLGVATLRARRLHGRSAWAPLFVLAGGLVAAPFYSFDKVVHFILLGLLWGGSWLYMALVGHRHINPAAIQATPATAMGRAASEVG